MQLVGACAVINKQVVAMGSSLKASQNTEYQYK